MMWDYVQLEDETQIAYSDMRTDNTVLVTVERPRDWGFDTARCVLPAFEWSDVDGFSEHEMADLDEFVHDNAPLILRYVYEGRSSHVEKVEAVGPGPSRCGAPYCL
jgi:hypothetical protein